MPRKFVFQDFKASGCPESLFFKFFEFRDSPKACFSDFSSFGAPRRFIFTKNSSPGHPETLFFRISIFRDAPKHDFSRFSGSQCRDEPMISFFCRYYLQITGLSKGEYPPQDSLSY